MSEAIPQSGDSLAGDSGAPAPLTAAEAARRQRAYAAKRRAWAKTVGRPYTRRDRDPRPPPGEIDVPAEE